MIRFERIYSASGELSNALNAVADKDVNQKAMAGFYEDCIIADTLAKREGRDGVDFAALNTAIVKRWPPRVLSRIKTMAWQQLNKKYKKQAEAKP